jgi:hypothetical protein
MTICKNCKYGVIGNYSRIYKGCPIGCNRPDNDRAYKHKGTNGCFVAKEKHNG